MYKRQGRRVVSLTTPGFDAYYEVNVAPVLDELMRKYGSTDKKAIFISIKNSLKKADQLLSESVAPQQK